MARSYKKRPYYKDGSPRHRRLHKKQANKKVRLHKILLTNGNFYRKLYDQLEIYEFKSHYPLTKWLGLQFSNCASNYTIFTKENWCKFYYRK